MYWLYKPQMFMENIVEENVFLAPKSTDIVRCPQTGATLPALSCVH